MWEILDGDKKQRIDCSNLCYFLLCVLSLYNKNLCKQVYSSEKENEPNFETKIIEIDETKQYGFINDINIFLCNLQQSNKIAKDFYIFNLNRSKFISSRKILKDYNIYDFKPKINKNSDKLAKINEAKITKEIYELKEDNSEIIKADILYYKKTKVTDKSDLYKKQQEELENNK